MTYIYQVQTPVGRIIADGEVTAKTEAAAKAMIRKTVKGIGYRDIIILY